MLPTPLPTRPPGGACMSATVQSANRAPRPSSLADVLDIVLDKGVVIDAYVRLAVLGIELVTVDARVVIASVDTYLRFAEAVNRLDIQPDNQATGLPGLVDQMTEVGAQRKTRSALQGVTEKAKEVAASIGGNDAEQEQLRVRRRRPSG